MKFLVLDRLLKLEECLMIKEYVVFFVGEKDLIEAEKKLTRS